MSDTLVSPPAATPTALPDVAPLIEGTWGAIGTDDSVDFVGLVGDLIVGFEDQDERPFVWPLFWERRASFLAAPPHRERYQWLPFLLSGIEPLWTRRVWTSAEVEAANELAGFIAPLEGAPAVVFHEGSAAANHAALEAIVRWFCGLADRPEFFAWMVGPGGDLWWARLHAARGERCETHGDLEPVSILHLGDDVELRLCRRDALTWLLECRRAGESRWIRALDLPGMSEPRLTDATSLGAFGQQVSIRPELPAEQGIEYRAYLSAESELLFYAGYRRIWD